ncbi:MAG TPA: amino acid adenylation domain-containing protein, partial [Thermoanaerobaculia bacterium]|nr:amino acid adenylation domain-containing protein [Thermoanaerobaculia bacterium]
LPTDRPRPARRNVAGGVRRFDVEPGTAEAIRSLARAEGASPFMVLLAGFAAFLRRLSGQDDFAVGVPVAGRDRRETEELIGLFVNTLAVRVDLAAGLTFRELVRPVRDEVLAAQTHQEVPFERLVEELQPERAGDRPPLAQVLFAFMSAAGREPVRMEGLTLSLEEADTGTAKFDLTVNAHERDGRLFGWLEHRTDLFDPATASRLTEHYTALLAESAASPDRLLADMDPLSEAQRHQLLVEWNAASLEAAGGPPAIRLFEARAARTPEALALVAAGERLTYGDLDRRADRLARRLRRLGVGPEARVGLLLERSAGAVVAILAVWKAGGAYVPLSPNLPQERLDWMAADAGLAAVIANEDPAWGVPVVRPEEGEDGGDLPAVEPDCLAYLIYTSGTTGRPKAVLVEQRNLSSTLRAAQLRFGFNEGDRMLHLASFSFDISLFELLPALLAGGTVELLTRTEVLDLPGLAARVLGATRVHAVPSLMRQIVDQLEGAQAGPRTIFTGGDRVPPDLLRDLRRTFPGSEVAVLYGPTEATIICSADPLGTQVEERTVIGRPLPGSSLLVTDRDGNPAPIGVPGELLVGGAGVTRGYLGRPDLTAEKYVPGAAGRLYRTGDLARWLPDGRVEFLGRVDTQVKIRGFRVEPGEIEALLRAEDGVRDAVVVVRERGGDRRLTAYVVPAGDTPDFERLRSALEERLPEYMIPAAWVALPELPLTPHGKVDRRALPEPGEEPRRTVAPRTLVEEVLCSLWAEILGVERVGVHDGFFDLGGHSLLATQLVSRLRRDLGVEIPLAALFEGPTVAALAPKVEAALRGETEAAPPILRHERHERTAPLPLSFAQERLWFLDRLEPGPLYNIPTAARLTGPLHPPALAAALDEIVRRHETLRTRFAERDRRPVQEILPWTPAALPVVDLSGLPGGRRREAVLEGAAAEALSPFDLSAGRPLRTVLTRLDAEEHVLLLTVHHIAADGWSMGVLLAELSVLYDAALAGGPSPLPELPVQYADFALWQREWLRGRRLERELEYWRRALEGAPEALDLPTDRPRQSRGTPRGGSRPFRIDRETWGALTALARGRGWTPFMLLLAAFEELLARYSHQRDVVVGSPIANRNRAEIEGLIGFFANTLVLRMDLGGDPTFADLVDRARTVTLEAYAHQDLPFEKLVEDLAPRREAGRTPLFQVMLALQNAPLRLELPGLGLEVLELESATAKFDLVLALVEADGGLSGGMEYDRGLFDEATVGRLLNHLGTFVEAAVAAPDAHLSSLGMLTAAERWQLAAWSRPPREYREGWCVHERVAERAALHPEAEAVVFGDESLTYGEFLRRARRLAVRLRELGVGPDVPVGIFLERSLDLPVAILGVLEAGGAYLPLDPGYPRERLRLMLEDAQAPVVLTQESLLGALPSCASLPLLVREAAAEDGPIPASPRVLVDPENLVYLIYTSGSTGRPKGVAMTHAAISAMLDWQLRTSVAGDGRTLQFAALSFDVSFQEMFSAWCAGGAVVMVSEDVRRDPPALLRLLEEARVERLFLPFVALQQLALAARAGEAPSSLREVMSAGEQLYVTPQVAAFFAAIPGAELHNHYGPSETHAATWLDLTGAPESWPERPSVGIPLDHARIFLLDLEMQPVPAGVPGEIFIGGRGLARGY